MRALDSTASPAFTGVRGRFLAQLLQLDFVRFHRVQLGVVECPRQYTQFLADVVGPKLFALPGRLGVFGKCDCADERQDEKAEHAERVTG